MSDTIPGVKQPESAFTRATAAMSRAHQLCTRVGMLADRLVGAVPEELNGGAGSSGSVFDDLHVSATITNELVDAAMRALDRIESALP